MKLLCCHQCSDIFSLTQNGPRSCECGAVNGTYLDAGNAEVFGKPGRYSVLGFANSSFIGAIKNQKEHGDLPGFFGRRFEAFIIPEKAESVTRLPKEELTMQYHDF
jgi:hypothetical protein